MFNTLKILCLVSLLPQTIYSRGVSPTWRSHIHYHYGGNLPMQGQKEVPLFIAHRGDKALIPEHTVPAYDIAMLENVDFVEPDLVMTRDQVLVCHHDVTLKDGTDVSERLEFASLMRQNITLFLDGKNVTILNDWLISDFTYDQLKTLKVRQSAVGVRPQHFNGFFAIPTFEEYIAAVHKDTWRRRQFRPLDPFVMGMIPELKHPDYHNSLFHTDHLMESIFLKELGKNGYLDESCEHDGAYIPCSPMIVQCFHIDTIKYLSTTTSLSLLTLLDMQNLRYLTYKGLAELENNTDYIGIWKELLFTGVELETNFTETVYDPEEIKELGGFIKPEDLIEYAHGLGINVAIYTIYQSYEPSKRGCARECVNGTKEEELRFYFDLGVDMFFLEGISESLRIRDRHFGYVNRKGFINSGSDREIAALGSFILAITVFNLFR